jgi:hypothetical protein
MAWPWSPSSAENGNGHPTPQKMGSSLESADSGFGLVTDLPFNTISHRHSKKYCTYFLFVLFFAFAISDRSFRYLLILADGRSSRMRGLAGDVRSQH